MDGSAGRGYGQGMTRRRIASAFSVTALWGVFVGAFVIVFFLLPAEPSTAWMIGMLVGQPLALVIAGFLYERYAGRY